MANNNVNTSADHSLYVKIPVWRKFTFGLIDMANNFSWSLVSSYLSIFYTDIFLIPTGIVSMLFLVARFWDAINDPLVGTWSDRTRTKMGRFRPWILIACIPMVIMTMVTFTAHPDWSITAKTIYIFITYGVLVFLYTCVNIPYSAMTSAITQDPKERGSLASWRLTLAVAGALIVAQIIANLYPVLAEKTDPAMGYTLCALILGCIAIAFYMIGVLTHKEVVVPDDTQKTKKVSFIAQLKGACKNKGFIIAILAHFAYGVFSYGRSGIYMYYFTYNMGNPVYMGSFMMFLMIPMIAGTFTSQFVANKLRSKGRVLTIAGIGYGAILILEYFLVPSLGITFLNITSIIAGYLSGWFASMSYAIIPDLTETGELETGVRMDGFYSSFTSFLNKLGIALGTAGSVAAIGIAGYVANAETQTAAVTAQINIWMYIVPAVISIALGILFLFYKLDYDRFEEVLAKLQAKKALAGSNN